MGYALGHESMLPWVFNIVAEYPDLPPSVRVSRASPLTAGGRRFATVKHPELQM
ncbi:hypothetical protein ABZ783_30505 [Micromonospora sp. NPDC047738]|uniref:hypothetical protein n=1 Tax=Micromonospora sp. NPDC047738 TaxID=3155741 RepID=UPI0033D08E5C